MHLRRADQQETWWFLGARLGAFTEAGLWGKEGQGRHQAGRGTLFRVQVAHSCCCCCGCCCCCCCNILKRLVGGGRGASQAHRITCPSCAPQLPPQSPFIASLNTSLSLRSCATSAFRTACPFGLLHHPPSLCTPAAILPPLHHDPCVGPNTSGDVR